MFNQLNSALLLLKIKADNFFRNERGDVNVVAIVVLIAVAVTLALFFKDEIADILERLIGGIGDKADTALDDI